MMSRLLFSGLILTACAGSVALATGAPAAAAGAQGEAVQVTVVHRQPAVAVKDALVMDGGKTLPAGDYDVSLVRLEKGRSVEHLFEFRKAGGDDIVATLGGVRAELMARGRARLFLGMNRDPERIKAAREARLARAQARMESPDGTSREPEETKNDKSADESEPRRLAPLLINYSGSSAFVAYWEHTEAGGIKGTRVYSTSATVKPKAN